LEKLLGIKPQLGVVVGLLVLAGKHTVDGKISCTTFSVVLYIPGGCLGFLSSTVFDRHRKKESIRIPPKQKSH